jgi:hypothetical protein
MSWLSKTWRAVRHSRVGRWIGEALLAKATGAVVDRATRDGQRFSQRCTCSLDTDTRDARHAPGCPQRTPPCSFCGAPMVPSDLAVTGWVCVKPHGPERAA